MHRGTKKLAWFIKYRVKVLSLDIYWGDPRFRQEKRSKLLQGFKHRKPSLGIGTSDLFDFENSRVMGKRDYRSRKTLES